MRETWLGGFIHEAEDGSKTYVIRKQVAGTRYEVSTRCVTERAALKQLERFEADPEGYSPGSSEKKKEPVLLDVEVANRFLTWCRDVKKNSPLWVGKQKRYVAWWATKLKGKNLAKLSLKYDIEAALVGEKAIAHRIATIKAIYSWLRKVDRTIALPEDPTFGTLSVPQSDPHHREMKDKSIPAADYTRVREHLEGHWRAALEVQLGTGWHLSEVKRFAEGGAIEKHPTKAEGVAGVLVCPEAKEGGLLRTAVKAEVRAAGEVLLKRGSFSIEKYGLAIKAGCDAANAEITEAAIGAKKKPKLIKPFTPGRIRHTVATNAINSGNDPAMVSAFLNHKNPRTTRKFYATHAVAAMITTPL